MEVKTNMKKLLCLTLTVMLLAGANMIVCAEEVKTEEVKTAYVNQYEKEFEILKAFGIVDIYGTSVYDGSAVLTRAETASIIVRMLNIDVREAETQFKDVKSNNPYSGYINFVGSMGIMKGNDDCFLPDDVIKIKDFIKIMVDVLGYGIVAENKGGYPVGYLLQASSLGILSGITVNNDEEVTRDMAVKLIYNCVNIDLLNVYKQNDGSNFAEQLKNETFLTYYHKIYKSEGIIDGNENTTLSGIGTLGKGKISVNNVIFADKTFSSEKLLGYDVKYYYRYSEADGICDILYIEASSDNEVIFIDYKDITSYINYEYCYTENDKKKKADTNKTTDIIYNGKRVYSPFAAYVPALGDVTLIDNNGDNIYDVAIINDYSVMEIGSVYNKKIIYDYNDSSTLIDTGDQDITVHLYKDNNEAIDTEYLKKSDVLMCSKSQDGKLINCYLCPNVISGTIESISTDNNSNYREIVIDGSTYNINLLCTELYSQTVQVSDKISVVLNKQGDIIYKFENTGLSEKKIGYIVKAAETGGIDEKAEILIFTSDNTMETFDCVKKVIIESNGTQYIPTSPTDAINKLSASGAVKNQIVVYETNNNKEIEKITYAPDYSSQLNENKSGLQIVWQGRSKYYSRHKSFQGHTIVSSDSVVFSIPNNIDKYDDYKALPIAKYSNSDGASYTVYKTTENTIKGEIIVGTDLMSLTGNKGMLVESAMKSINSNGENAYLISGYNNGDKVKYATDDEDVLDGITLHTGDYITYSVYNGLITAVKVMFNSSTRVIDGTENPYPALYDGYENRYLYGGVYSKNKDIISVCPSSLTGVINFSTITKSSVEYMDLSEFSKCYIVDMLSNIKIKAISVNELKTYIKDGEGYSKILALWNNWGSAYQIIIYK